MTRSIPTAVLTSSVALLLTSAGTRAQSTPIDAQIAFVRGLLEELHFTEFAQFEIDHLRAQTTDPASLQRLAALQIEVLIGSAERLPDPAARRRLFLKALDQADELLERYPDEPIAETTRKTLISTCVRFGRMLNEQLEIAREEGAHGEAIRDLETAAADVFRRGRKAAESRQELCADEGDSIESYVAWMQRGILLREHARAIPADRKILSREAAVTLENLILEVGEETALGQRALFELAQIEEVRGDLDRAIRSYTDTIDAIWIALTGDQSAALPETVQRLMFHMMQEVYDRLAQVCLRSGQFERIDGLVGEWRDRIAEFRTEPHPRFGDSLLLTQARSWAVRGTAKKVSEALRAAKSINERHSRDFIGMRAKNLMRDLLRDASERITPDLLFEIAKGDFQARRYESAIRGCKQGLRHPDTESDPGLAFELWTQIGSSNERLQRRLPAALAYSRALDHADTEEVSAARKTQIAGRASRCLRKARSDAGATDSFAAIRTRIDGLLTEFSPEFATANRYTSGLRAKANRDYARAAKLFSGVDESYDKYELALGHGILSMYHAEKFDEALQWIRTLRRYTTTHPLEEDDRAGQVYRPQALAWAHYAEGRIRYLRAEPGDDAAVDPAVDDALIAHFRTFEEVHAPHADNLLPIVREILGRLQIRQGRLKLARSRYQQLLAMAMDHPNAHRALGAILFRAYTDEIDRLTADLELRRRQPDQVEGTALRAIETALESARRRALDFGLAHSRSLTRPSYALLYNVLRIGEELEDWPQTESAANRLLDLYADAERDSLDQVRAVLGEALLRQPGRFREALDVLKDARTRLDADEQKTTAYYEVLRLQALALGGWPALDADKINFAPRDGLGRPDEAYEILWGEEYRKFALHSSRAPKYSLRWYRYYLELYFLCRKAERIDSKFDQRADTFYNIASSTDEFQTLHDLGPRGAEMETLFRLIPR